MFLIKSSRMSTLQWMSFPIASLGWQNEAAVSGTPHRAAPHMCTWCFPWEPSPKAAGKAGAAQPSSPEQHPAAPRALRCQWSLMALCHLCKTKLCEAKRKNREVKQRCLAAPAEFSKDVSGNPAWSGCFGKRDRGQQYLSVLAQGAEMGTEEDLWRIFFRNSSRKIPEIKFFKKPIMFCLWGNNGLSQLSEK